jgi:hypothetical protein
MITMIPYAKLLLIQLNVWKRSSSLPYRAVKTKEMTGIIHNFPLIKYIILGINCSFLARFTSVILATQEAEIRRIMVKSQPWQIVVETLSQKNYHKKEVWQGG